MTFCKPLPSSRITVTGVVSEDELKAAYAHMYDEECASELFDFGESLSAFVEIYKNNL